MRQAIVTFISVMSAASTIYAEPIPEFQWRAVEIDKIEIGYGLQMADVNGDGKVDIVAAARQTKNLVIFFNERE